MVGASRNSCWKLRASVLRIVLPGRPFSTADIIFLQDHNGFKSAVAEQMTVERTGRKFQRHAVQPIRMIDRFRMARRGDRLIFLYATKPTERFQVLAQMPVSTEELRLGAIEILAHAGGEGRKAVLEVKSIDLRAEAIR